MASKYDGNILGRGGREKELGTRKRSGARAIGGGGGVRNSAVNVMRQNGSREARGGEKVTR